MRSTVFFLVLCWMSLDVYAHEIALTFDDLPAQEVVEIEGQRWLNERILDVLKKHEALAVGFVNEGKLYSSGYTEEKTGLLKLWVENGHELGNHTYSHKAYSRTPDEEFFTDIERGGVISRELMQSEGRQYRYFRHPYLDMGEGKSKKENLEYFLAQKDYVVAPVTIDTADWRFNYELKEHPELKDEIIKEYLEYTQKKFAFFEKASEKMFGRNIKHVWLLHANELNAYALDDVLEIARAFGYHFTSLKNVLEDKAYASPNNYTTSYGVSWMYRWDKSGAKKVDWSADPRPYGYDDVVVQKIKHYDKKRGVWVHALLYEKKGSVLSQPVAVLLHRLQLKCHEYSYIAKALASKGYRVLSVEYEKSTTESGAWLGEAAEHVGLMLDKTHGHSMNTPSLTLIGDGDGVDVVAAFLKKYSKSVKSVVFMDKVPQIKMEREPSFPMWVMGSQVFETEHFLKTVYIKGLIADDFSDRGSFDGKSSVLKHLLQCIAL